jgi:signal peptidase I
METIPDTTPRPSWLRTILIGRRPKRTLVRIVVVVATAFVVFNYALLPIRVEGSSMLPTYRNHGINFINRLAYRHHDPQRGDVVAVRTTGLHNMYMKRVIGLPGETVAFHNGHAVINGQVLKEPYVKFACDWELPPEVLGPDEFFCVGDNRSMNPSEHFMFRAPRSRIVGKVLL